MYLRDVTKHPFFIISFILHSIMLVLLTLPVLDKHTDDSQKSMIEVTLTEPTSKQTVDQIYKNQIKPKNSQFLGKQNQEIKNQTVARNKSLSLKDLIPKNNFSYKNSGGEIKSADRVNKLDRTESSLEKYKNIKNGPENALSSDEFKYFSYYQRIREQLANHWYSDIRARMQRLQSMGQLRSRDRTTRTLVTLDNRGNLIKVQIISPSGLEDLDSSSLQAFKSANPFPNPPKDLISKDGVVVISWDFILEVD